MACNGEYRIGGKKVYRFSAESASDCRKICKIIATSRRANEILVVREKKYADATFPRAARQMWV